MASSSSSCKRSTRIDLDIVPDYEQPSRPTLQKPQQETLTQDEDDSTTRQTPSHQSPISTGTKLIKKGILKDLRLPQVVEARTRLREEVKSHKESPWIQFTKVYELKLNELSSIAVRKAWPCEIVSVKGFEPDGRKKLQMLQQIKHINFIAVLDVFHFDNIDYTICEYAPLSLTQIVASPPYPTEPQLAAILGQILRGLDYLTARGLFHGSLTCSNVLLTTAGVAKIANQEHCNPIGQLSDSKGDLQALGRIGMELMQKYTKDDGTVGVENLDRWPVDSKAVSFLSETTSADSVKELNQHPLIKSPWQVEELKWLVELAALSARRGYRYSRSWEN